MGGEHGDAGANRLRIACAGINVSHRRPAEEASAVVDRWSATYSANDRHALAKLYAPDALLLGTTDQVATRGTDEISVYFVALDKGGRKNTIKERDIIVLGPEAVVVAGFYDFSRKEQNYEPRPSRFTMVG